MPSLETAGTQSPWGGGKFGSSPVIAAAPRKVVKRFRKDSQAMPVMPKAREQSRIVAENIITTIESGILDSQLREIARALFRRRDNIAGTNSFIDAIDKAEGTIVDVVPDPVADPRDADILLPDSISPSFNGRTFMFRGKTYSKHGIEGRRVRIPRDFPAMEYRGHTVRVSEIARTKMSVVFDPPVNLVTRQYSVRNAAREGKSVTMPTTALAEVLDGA